MTSKSGQLAILETESDRSLPATAGNRSSKTVRIDCPKCDLPAAEIVKGTMLIRSRHHGRLHIIAVSLEQVKRLMEKNSNSVS